MNTQKTLTPASARRRGLTLLELLVVLVVLVALAGILTPLLPSVARQSHGAAGADNIKEITKSVQLYEANEGSQPNNLDALIRADGTSYLAGAMWNVVDLGSDANGQRIADALNDAGITTSHLHRNAGDMTNNTFDTHEGSTNTIDASAPSGQVLSVAGAMAETWLGLDPAGTYVVFGLGSKADTIGKTMVDAPIMYSDDQDPIGFYARFVLVYEIPASGAAKLVSVAGNHSMNGGAMNMLAGMDHHLNEYYESKQ